jgi:uncharacterized tellurite resistance protein B-like protein
MDRDPMLEALRKVLFGDDSSKVAVGHDEVQFAVALLLTEAASMDGAIDDAERNRIRTLLSKRFSLAPAVAETLMRDAVAAQAERVEFYGPSRTLKDAFSYEQRIELLEMLWDVVFADGLVHDHESNLMRRLSGLLYVDDQDSGAARKRVLDRRGLS